MLLGIWFPGAVAVIDGEIWVAGGWTRAYTYSGTPAEAGIQIYNPVTDTWRTVGLTLPTPLQGGGSAVVDGVWYVMGGSTNGGTSYTNATWAFDLTTKTWSARAPMPTTLHDAGVAVVHNIIYLVGGNSEPTNRANTVESYNPATDTWTEEAPLLFGKSEPSVGAFGTTIVAADGYTDDGDNGDNEGYDVATNRWTPLAFDPTPRNVACTGAINTKLYVAGGAVGPAGTTTLTESFELPTNTWQTLAPMPQGTQFPASAVHDGRLYCLGGGQSFPDGPVLTSVQIYQP
jgi:N-acetylneuraminic acid mutarotase